MIRSTGIGSLCRQSFVRKDIITSDTLYPNPEIVINGYLLMTWAEEWFYTKTIRGVVLSLLSSTILVSVVLCILSEIQKRER